ncbi:MAG: sugar transferase [Candidatus Omnitrophica bacterium]|nr:sugar transferase [Candidatus Omnitrophota bacterium]
MLREKDDVVRRAMMIFDGLVLTLSFVLAYWLRHEFHRYYRIDIFAAFSVPDVPPSMGIYTIILLIVVPLWCMVLHWNGMYRSLRTATSLEVVWIIVKSVALATLVFSSFVFLFKLKFISRLFFTIFLVISSSALLVEKLVIFSISRYVRRQGYNYRRILIVGIGSRAARFINKIDNHPEWGFKVEGVLDYDENMVGQKVEEVDVIGTLDHLQDILHKTPIDDVIFVIPRSGLNAIEKALYICETAGVKATIAADLFELKIAKLRQTELDGTPLLIFDTIGGEEWQFFIKRALDIVFSGLGLMILSPLFLIVTAAIRMTSPGPVFFFQKRVGLNGRTFTMYKFRTMYRGSHQRRLEFSDLNMMAGPVFKIKNDPRVTPIGRFLRKFSIDELPQLVNVFIGQMSLVGPRPPLHMEVVQYQPWQRRRLSMRPGLTCLWQISGRNRINFDDWMKLDLEYIDEWSLWLDFKIIMKTVPVVLFGIGAY